MSYTNIHNFTSALLAHVSMIKTRRFNVRVRSMEFAGLVPLNQSLHVHASKRLMLTFINLGLF